MSDFNGNTITGGGTGTTVTWTGLESGSASALTAISPGAGFAVAGKKSTGDNVYINHNLNIDDRANPRGYSFTFTPGVGYDLSSMQLDTAHLNESGGNQAFDSDLVVSITNGGTVFTETRSVDYEPVSSPPFLTQTYDLTGTSLSASTTYTVSVTMNNMVGAGAFFAADNFSISAVPSAVPEPSSLATFCGVLGLMGMRRRRKQ